MLRSHDDLPRELLPLLARFAPRIRALVPEARRRLRQHLPTAIELVYDNARRLAFGFASSERASDIIVSLVVDARGASLCFPNGIQFPDPNRLLMGRGKRRCVRLESAAQLDDPAVTAMLRAATGSSGSLPQSGHGRFVIKSISPRRKGAHRASI